MQLAVVQCKPQSAITVDCELWTVFDSQTVEIVRQCDTRSLFTSRQVRLTELRPVEESCLYRAKLFLEAKLNDHEASGRRSSTF